MRKNLLFILLGSTVAAGAVTLTPEAALKRAVASPQFKTMSTAPAASPRLVYTEEYGAEPATYLFDRGNDAGYLVVAADDRAAPLLGYSDSGSVNPSDMPDGLRYWLGYYAAEIGSIRTSGAVASAASASADRAPIAPMVATRWNQGAPYNNLCPEIGTERTVTGCVATALAQVMKYHNWPPQGKGSSSYTWQNETLSLDYSTVTYDWNNMLNEYGASATDAQKNAVATLMYSCGVAVEMNYGTGASGAVSKNCGQALVEYFNYDGSLRYLERDFYALTDWENEVYSSLADGCPVLYGGQSAEGGHEFVCDGYSSDGYFHFNWGWGGMSDGYFRLTALNPGAQGIGGAGSGAGYNFSQDVIVGIKPYAGQADFSPVLVNSSDFAVEESEVNLPGAVNVAAKVRNMSYITVNFKLGIAITDAQGAAVYAPWSYTNTNELKPGYGFTSPYAYNVALPELADGVYSVAPAFIADGKWYDIKTAVGKVSSVKMTVAGGVAKFTAPAVIMPQVTEYSFVSTLYSGMPFTINGTIENTGELEFYDSAYGVIITESGNTLLSALQLDLEPGQTAPFTYSGTIPDYVAAGSYQFVIVARASDGYRQISEIKEITIKDAPASTQLSLGPVSFVSGSNHVPKNDLGIKTSLTCTAGAYYGTLDLVVFRKVSATEWTSCADFPSEMLYLEEGNTTDIVYNSNFSNGNIGETYLAMFYYDKKRFETQQLFVLDDVNGVASIAADTDVAVELYDLMGRRVDNAPAPGHYIMVRHASDGTSSTSHVVIR